MKQNITIQLKAAFLIIVFALNTVVGFACAIGIDMGFNTTHHHDGEATETHSADKICQHHKPGKHHHDSKESSENGGCCNDHVIKFQNLDKSVNTNVKTSINHTVMIAFVTGPFGNNTFKYKQVPAHKYYLPFFHPPPPDIRILIQSFQI